MRAVVELVDSDGVVQDPTNFATNPGLSSTLTRYAGKVVSFSVNEMDEVITLYVEVD